jgi:hypothetical protein
MDNKKTLVPVLISTMLMLASCNTFAASTAEDTWTVYNSQYLGLEIKIEAPRRVDPGENITITITAGAHLADIDVVYISVDICSLVNETEEFQLKNISFLSNSKIKHRQMYKDHYNVTIPNDTSPGLTYGFISCEWEFEGAIIRIPRSGFMVTYVRNSELEELQAAYDELNATHHALLSNYTDIDSKYVGELGGARNLMYVFVATTVIAVGTVLFLILRRPKTFYA